VPAGQELLQQSGGTFEGLRSYLRQLAVAAYEQKAAAVDDIEPGLMQEAQKFFVLTQTDNLWKEHLQVRGCRVPSAGGNAYGVQQQQQGYKLT
jgi:preprotein translocase subunit SecA